MKALVYRIAWLMVACCHAVVAEASSEFVNGSTIKVMTAENRAMDGNEEMVIFRKGTAEGKPEAEKVKLKITNEFKPKPRDEYKLSGPIYKWDGKEGALSYDEKGKEEMEFTTTEKSWGKKFKVKGSIEYKDIPLDEKNKEELPNQEGPAKADIDVLTPVVKVKSVTFRHGKENSSLPVAEDAEGKLVPAPEYQADAGDKETAILYAAESTPVIQVCFDVKPDGLKMGDVEIKGEVGKRKESILKELTMEKADNQNFDANSKIPFKAAKLEKKVAMGNVSHEFTITYKGIQLEKKPDYSVGKAYIVLGKPVGPWEKKTPWKDVLEFSLEKCETKDKDNFHSVICNIKKNVSVDEYDEDARWWWAQGVDLKGFLKRGKEDTSNCSDVAVLTYIFTSLFGKELVIHRCYPMNNPTIPGAIYRYHAYTLDNGKVYDPRAKQGGDGTLTEEEFYDFVGKAEISLLYREAVQPPYYWAIPFSYIKNQKKKILIKTISDVPGKEGVIFDLEVPRIIFLEEVDVSTCFIK